MMYKKTKFIKLFDYLNNLVDSVDNITLTFKQIEEILGFKLCNSAYIYFAYWEWKGSPTHILPNLIKEAGYPKIIVNLSNQKVYLSKI